MHSFISLLLFCQFQVSSVTDHVGVQDSGTKTADFDDDDGGGLVSQNFSCISWITFLEYYSYCFPDLQIA